MEIKAVKTRLVAPGDDINQVIAESIPHLDEGSVLTIASKIFTFAENRLVDKVTDDRDEKHNLVKQEAEYWIDPHSSKYDMMFTIKGNWMFVNAGIDESNAMNKYALWPKDPQASVNRVWQFLRQHYHLNKVGVIMTDSRSFPLNWGVVGHGIAHCGFEVLKSYIGTEDLHGRAMKMEQLNMMQCMAAAAVVEMGEGDERTPIAIVTQVRDLVFQDREPSEAELKFLKISLEDDAYAPIIKTAPWQKGGGN